MNVSVKVEEDATAPHTAEKELLLYLFAH